MIRKLATALLLGAALLPATAPEASAQISFGLLGGLNRTTFTGNGTARIGSRTGFMFGGVTDIPLTKNLSIRPELYFSTKGSQLSVQSSILPLATLDLFYLQLPVLVDLHPASEATVRPHLFGGLSLGFPLRCRLDSRDCGETEGLDPHTFDASVLVGVEVEFHKTGIGIRYGAGLISVGKSAGAEIYNGVLSFTVRHFGWPRGAGGSREGSAER